MASYKGKSYTYKTCSRCQARKVRDEHQGVTGADGALACPIDQAPPWRCPHNCEAFSAPHRTAAKLSARTNERLQAAAREAETGYPSVRTRRARKAG